MDNFIMIIAGESIDEWFGVALGLSTMAAAGLGNAVSDLVGSLSEGVIEKANPAKQPQLTHDQRMSDQFRYAKHMAKGIGIVVGCLLGMVPLLFLHADSKEKAKLEQEKALKVLKGHDRPTDV